MFKKILIAVVALIVLFVIVVAMQPSEMYIERSLSMVAPSSAVFNQVNDFRKWEGWSPWAKIDPDMQVTFDGPATGVGAKYAWVGNAEVGEGNMIITESRPRELVKIDLNFVKPFASSSVTEFKLIPEGDQTKVTWSMTGQKNFLTKVFCLFLDMDAMLGRDFEKGLESMKSIVEATGGEDQ